MSAAPRSRRFRVAAIQMTSTGDTRRNLRRADRLIDEAAAAGADLIALPENFAYLRAEGTRPALRERLDGPLVTGYRDRARESGRWLLLGSIPERIARSPRIHNTSVLIAPDGKIAAVYRKLHLFDVRIRGGAWFEESRFVSAGDRVVVADTPLGRLGLSICYDLRFPELYRQMVLRGAEVLFVPAAFTAYTGPDHWLALLRARAIENQCHVVAPAQWGRHSAKRHSHGETVILDPWGTTLAAREEGEGWVVAEIDPDRTARVRRGLPALEHVRRELWRAPRGRTRR